jgi:hypothetical protein
LDVIHSEGSAVAITEEGRHHLYQRLEEVLGREEATTLMEHLPPVGWADVATKRDLDALETRMDARFAQVDGRFALIDGRLLQIDGRFESLGNLLRAEMWKSQRNLMVALIAANTTLVGFVLAAAKLFE